MAHRRRFAIEHLPGQHGVPSLPLRLWYPSVDANFRTAFRLGQQPRNSESREIPAFGWPAVPIGVSEHQGIQALVIATGCLTIIPLLQ